MIRKTDIPFLKELLLLGAFFAVIFLFRGETFGLQKQNDDKKQAISVFETAKATFSKTGVNVAFAKYLKLSRTNSVFSPGFVGACSLKCCRQLNSSANKATFTRRVYRVHWPVYPESSDDPPASA